MDDKEILNKLKVTIPVGSISISFMSGDKTRTLKNNGPIEFNGEELNGGSPSALLPGGSSKKSTRRKRTNRKRKQGTKSKRARRNRSSRNK